MAQRSCSVALLSSFQKAHLWHWFFLIVLHKLSLLKLTSSSRLINPSLEAYNIISPKTKVTLAKLTTNITCICGGCFFYLRETELWLWVHEHSSCTFLQLLRRFTEITHFLLPLHIFINNETKGFSTRSWKKKSWNKLNAEKKNTFSKFTVPSLEIQPGSLESRGLEKER